MATPTYQQLVSPSQGGAGLVPEGLEERILTVLAMLASGANPDGTISSSSTTAGILPPTTLYSNYLTNNTVMPVANRGWYCRCLGAGTITKIGIQVGTSSGNVCVGIYASNNGFSPPTTLLSSSGIVPCPAAGNNTITIPSVTVNQSCYFALGCDNATATFAGQGAAMAGGLTQGQTYQDNTATSMPLPATAPSLVATYNYTPMMLGLP